MRPPAQYLHLLRQMGLRWVLYRAGSALRCRSGFLQRACPAVTWDRVPAPTLNLRLRTSVLTVPFSWGTACVEEAEAILQGRFRLFSYKVVAAGFPPDWHQNQLEALHFPEKRASSGDPRSHKMRHWSDISNASRDDIKGVWELSRFSWVFPLVRAYARTGDKRFAEAFWQLFTDWCCHNPPNCGPNWMCGQEATFRLMGIVFAVENLGLPVEHRDQVARFALATGQRIAAHFDYALSQKNNHGISECVGLITVATWLPRHDESADWLRAGLEGLEQQLAELVYVDGSFSQHSLIYHRVLLHDLTWCAHRLRLADEPVPKRLVEVAGRALDFLMVLTAPGTGYAPLFGANDGAYVLPLSAGNFLDLRPVIQLTAAFFRQVLPLPEGAWDEAAYWFVAGWEKLPRVLWPTPASLWHAPIGGYAQLCLGENRLFLRCPTSYRHRPSQADGLHVDVSYKGLPISLDGGSYSYNSRERFSQLGAAAHHNVLVVDNREPMRKFSRFLYLPWPKGRLSIGNKGITASYECYGNLQISWARTVTPRERGGFEIHDRICGAAGRHLRWHWRLFDGPWGSRKDSLEIHDGRLHYAIQWCGTLKVQSRLVRAAESTAWGWWSPHYSGIEPACSLLLDGIGSSEAVLTTAFFPL